MESYMKRLLNSLKFCETDAGERYNMAGVVIGEGCVTSTDGVAAYRSRFPYLGSPVFVPLEEVRAKTSRIKSGEVENVLVERNTLLLLPANITLKPKKNDKFPHHVRECFEGEVYKSAFHFDLDQYKKILLSLCDSSKEATLSLQRDQFVTTLADGKVCTKFTVDVSSGDDSSSLLDTSYLHCIVSSLSGRISVYLSYSKVRMVSNGTEIVVATIQR